MEGEEELVVGEEELVEGEEELVVGEKLMEGEEELVSEGVLVEGVYLSELPRGVRYCEELRVGEARAVSLSEPPPGV